MLLDDAKANASSSKGNQQSFFKREYADASITPHAYYSDIVLSAEGRPVPGASVLVYKTGTRSKAKLFNKGTTKAAIAIARALLNRPKIILADEPTGNLDPDNTASVLGYLSEFHHAGGTVILATHGTEAEQFADRIIYLHNGSIDNSG